VGNTLGPSLQPPRRRFRIRVLPLLGVLFAAHVLLLVYALYPRTMPQPQSLSVVRQKVERERLRPLSDFDSIADLDARSVALFMEAGRVIQSARCMNCHPRSDRPTQTDALRPHIPWVLRGVDGGGEPTLRCMTCHHETNFDVSGVPGNPKWKLAPIEMAWQGKTLGEICRQLLDPLHAHMSRDQLLRHMVEDELVGWAWHPGGTRKSAPGSQAEFGAIIKAWLDSGGKCPT